MAYPEQPTQDEWSRFIHNCVLREWTVRSVTHPKSRSQWASAARTKDNNVTKGRSSK